MEPETAHRMTLKVLNWLPSFCFSVPASKPISCMGLSFSHPLGLAAGLDKDGAYLPAIAKLGFSFIEIGTVTPRPQSGNPYPRLFRLLEDEALINRMGFNNHGVDELVSRISNHSYTGILGINIGKNKDTPLESAAQDYCFALKRVFCWADYVTINISSPNTPDLRRLQEEHFFETLLNQILVCRQQLADKHQKWLPLAVKVSPDESDEQLKRLADTVLKKGIEAIIATNTTASRDISLHSSWAQEPGGLSGKPLAVRANHCLQVLKTQVGNAVALVGVGGIDSAAAARERLAAGADLLQLYTGLIYQGPKLITEIVHQLEQRN